MSGVLNRLNGYPLRIYQCYMSALNYYATNVNTSDIPGTLSLCQILAQTFKNGRQAVTTYLLQIAFLQAYTDLSALIAIPLTLDSFTTSFMLNRIANLRNMSIVLNGVVSTPLPIPTAVSQNNPAVIFYDLTAFLYGYFFENPPAGLTINNFLTEAQDAASAWGTIATALLSQGVTYNPRTLDAVNLMQNCCQQVVNDISVLTLSPTAYAPWLWNNLISTQACLRYADVILSDPTSSTNQQQNILQLMAYKLFDQFNQAIVVLQQQQPPSQIQLETVRQNDTLPNIAARALGNFELWTQIAAYNNLVPPYISNVPGIPGVASPGQNLFISQPNGSVNNGNAIDYEARFLGTDLYLGPMNVAMNPWSGDFNLIQSYQNLSFSLGRRLQTTLRTLIFHPDFGSRIPPEIGSITDSRFAGQLLAFAQSAILADPRVDSIASLSIQVGPNSQSYQITGSVVPKGFSKLGSDANPILVGIGGGSITGRQLPGITAPLDVFILGFNTLA